MADYKFESIETLTPAYDQIFVLKGVSKGYIGKPEPTYAVCKWTKNGETYCGGPRLVYHRRDAWNLLEAGGYAEDCEISFVPTHWAPLPDDPGDDT